MAVVPQGTLNEFQRNRLMSSFCYIDRLLSDIQNVLASADSRSPFPQYVLDLSDQQKHELEEFITVLRRRMVELLGAEHMDPRPPQIPASRAIHSLLTYVDIAVAELRPRHMRGYGEVNEAAEEKLERLVAELDPLVLHIDRGLQGANSASGGTQARRNELGRDKIA